EAGLAAETTPASPRLHPLVSDASVPAASTSGNQDSGVKFSSEIYSGFWQEGYSLGVGWSSNTLLKNHFFPSYPLFSIASVDSEDRLM
ncbi:unnamed protein product, partial [Urochloa humidicola]